MPLFRTAIYTTAANVSIPLAALVTGPILARSLGPDGRGLLAALLSIVSLAGLMFTLGLPDSLTYYVARGRIRITTAIRFGLLGGGACGLVAWLLASLATPALLNQYPDYVLPSIVLCLTLPLSLAFAAVRGVVQGVGRFDAINRERVSGVGLRLVLILALAAGGLLTPLNAAWITVVAAIAGSLFLLPVLSASQICTPPEATSRDVALYARAAAAGSIGSILVVRLDQTLMVPLADAAQLGFYAVAVSLAELPITLVAAVRDIAFTTSARRDSTSIVAVMCRLTLLAMVPTALAGCLLVPIALPVLFGAGFAPAIAMTQVLFVGTVATVVNAILGAGLMSVGRAGLRSIVQLGGAAFTVGALVFLVPPFGGMGAAVATALTYTFMAVATIWLYRHASGVGFRECLLPKRSDLLLLRLRNGST